MRPVVLVPLIALALAACGGDNDPQPTASSTVARPHSTPTSAVIEATPTPTAPTGESAVQVTGLFTEPRPTAIEVTIELGSAPTTFSRWNGVDSVIYDTHTGEEINLGPGSLGRFSPDGTRMVWIATEEGAFGVGEAWMIDLATRERTLLGEGRLTGFTDDGHVGVTSGNTTELIDLATSERETVEGIPYYPDPSMRTTPDGHTLREARQDDYASDWTLTDPGGALLLRLTAYRVVPAGRGTLAVATPPQIESREEGTSRSSGTLNVFLVDVETGEATFIATSPWTYGNWPIAANDRFIAWTDDYCRFPDTGHTRVLERATGQIIEFSDVSLWVSDLTADDGLIVGAFGPKAIVDLNEFRYIAALSDAIDTTSSDDYRYISAGTAGGHGGLCP